ncbi:MAG: cyclopropane-fatty-acyl-phospholipid synthase family protein [Xanthomonadales bacterium]|jgi:cyclopropane-fatty-acyl-phospholipid synthase|nr:cyclopropane-fatty-acyl-phospholipid synthase family protein [Xanthomonadales bacterium]MDH3924386.1 cyclopropane-fatty-acyl-phospholipid synthase family protein [Xanthomonadales bacterium]MDH3941347.1 cyclopropane-fatty-acyl-phospholipid synthase family protein [Xanthomonadales bacterium]MDH4000901.1 cyclopropane-fatty-acyl-phospholipid synthase family protein [Xanthomonadales bacterium]
MSTAAIASSTVLDWSERGLVPDSVLRAGIRRLCRQRLKDIRADDIEISGQLLEAFVRKMNQSPVALVPELANEQHYEVPPEFFNEVLGKHAKYSCCHWGEETASLSQAEAEALDISCQRAGIEDGMKILDLGCGWGSLSLWIAEHYPACRIYSVSNSRPQGEHIRHLARERGLDNIQVVTRDMNDFFPDQTFDRIVSVEMFEHMRNYRELFGRISQWLNSDGRFFMHIFCHRSSAYEFLDEGPSDWMGRHFFSGGIMPSDDLPARFQEQLRLVRRDRWNGTHYEKTANAWLKNMDARRDRVLPIMAQTYGAENAERWFQRWRIFFMACAELFGYDNGREWYVSHYLFAPRD